MKLSAAFLDRDGTIIRDTGYPSRPEDVEVLPGAGEAIARLNDERIPVLVVTNQSGIGRGLLSAEDFARVQAELERRLARRGARIDGVYHCPHDPGVEACRCRKPGGALFERAAREQGIDPAKALYVGDRLRDLAFGVSCGGRCVLLVPEGVETAGIDVDGPAPGSAEVGIMVARDLRSAVERALVVAGSSQQGA